MTNRFTAIGVVAALGIGLLPLTAAAAPRTATTTCTVRLGSVTSDGDHRIQVMTASVPPTRTLDHVVGRNVYAGWKVPLSGPMIADPNAGGPDVSGYLVLGSAMWESRYSADAQTGAVLSSGLRRIGGGWGNFIAFDQSYYAPAVGTIYRNNTYGLRADGVLFRWTVDAQGVWRQKASYSGFAAVKSMALISQTRTYDTFLANTRGGALYTIRIPASSPLKPVVKLVRRSTWQGFESLVAERCGQYGVLLLGIDKDTRSGYLYAVGHANGMATVIQGRGKVPIALDDPVYFHWSGPADQPPFGE